MDEKVLLIDDEQDFLQMLADRMEHRGLKVATADSPKTVLEEINLEDFDAVVLDLMMPDMDGLELLPVLLERNPELQVILLTGHASIEKGVQAMKLGALDFLEKPVDFKILCEKIREAKQHKLLLIERRHEAEIKDIMASKPW